MTPDEPRQSTTASRSEGSAERRMRRSAGINTAFRAIGIELHEPYAEKAARRLSQMTLETA